MKVEHRRATARQRRKHADGKYSIAVLDKAFEILELLQAREEALSLDDIANHTGIARTTAHRLLHNLSGRGYVEKDSERYKYTLGVKLAELGNAVKRRQSLREIALPQLEHLRKKLQDTINLGVLVDGEVSYLEILESPHSFRIAAFPGARDPAHATALGKSILAFLEDGQVRDIVKSHGLKRLTRKTIGDEAALRTELAKVRAFGHAVDEQESMEGGRCVGVPIFGPEGKVIAGLSVSGPCLRITEKRIPMIARELKKGSAEISRRLGCGPGTR